MNLFILIIDFFKKNKITDQTLWGREIDKSTYEGL